MKTHIIILSLTLSLATATAQTFHVVTGNVTTSFAASADDMTYSNNGALLTILGKTFSTNEIDKIYIDTTKVDDNTVAVSWNGTSAHVTVSGNIAQYLTVTVSNANVSIIQNNNVMDEITYTLSGSSGNGSFYMDGKLKSTIVLNGLTLTSTEGGAITIDNGKRIAVEVANGTENSLVDAANGSQKACFFIKGHAEFTGGGTLNITGNAKHAYRSNEYTLLKKKAGIVNILGASNDGLHIEQYFEMRGGTVNINGVKGDGIDVSITDDSSDESNGQIIIRGGTLTVATTSDDVKAMKSNGGISISDGSIELTSTGAGSKGISTDGPLDISGGLLKVTTTGGIYAEDTDNESKPNAIKADGNLTISGGKVYVAASATNGKAFNTDGQFILNGGTVMGIGGKAGTSPSGSQGYKTYTGVKIAAGDTISYNSISYIVPNFYSNPSAIVLVSPVTTSTNSSLDDNNVTVVWDGTSAKVEVADKLKGIIKTNTDKGHVTIIADASLNEEVTYTLSGTSTDGSLYMDGSYKSSFVFDNLTLTCPDSAAINIRNGKRIAVQLSGANTLTDGSNGPQKACFAVKGHTEFKGDGTLTLYGNTAHAFWGKEYVQIKDGMTGTITIAKAIKDGMNVNQYFRQDGGTLIIQNVGDDGIQVSYKTDDNDLIETDNENTSEALINGGILNIAVTAAGAKGLKSEGDINIKGGDITISSNGGVAVDGSDLTSSVCLKSDASITIDAGNLILTNKGQGGRAILCDGDINVNGGIINARAEGNNYGSSTSGSIPGARGGFGSGGGGYGPDGGSWGFGGGRGGQGGGSASSNSKNAKSIKAKGNLNISGGSITAYSAAHEGIEAKAAINISGGTVNVTAADDAINSGGDMTISNGYIYAYSSTNDGLDANGDMYIQGGVVIGFGGSGAEAGIDIDEKHKLYITGGEVFCIGGRFDFSLDRGSQKYTTANASCSNGDYFVVSGDSGKIFAVKAPRAYSGAAFASSPSMTGNGAISTATSVSGIEVNGFVALK